MSPHSHYIHPFLFLSLLLFTALIANAQPEQSEFYDYFQVNIKKTQGTVKVDGKLDEALWQQAEIATNFWQKLPYYAEGADPKTEVKLTYDENNIYIAAKCYQSEPIIVQSLKRDDYWDNDGFGIVIDPLNTKANAYLFGCSAAGVQWDALRSETSGINDDWSNKWFAEVNVEKDFWTAEIAIPLRILKYREDFSQWGINFIRNAVFSNEFHNWTAVPEQYWPPNPAYAGSLVWDEAPKKKKGNFNLIPYVTAGLDKTADEDLGTSFDAGLDARVAVSSTLNLDLTVNPDFSQIEVDELVTNLTRFSIFLPEKRTFFLENSDIFGDYGLDGTRPFFSRTIGLDANRATVPILYGVRLSGNLTKDLRIGAMNIHSSDNDESPGQNHSAFSLQKKFGRSFIQGMFLNRQAFDKTDAIKNDYGRNLSLESAYISDDGDLSLWFGTHLSFKEDYKDKTGFYNAGLFFQNTRWEILHNINLMRENYFADMGFINRIENYDAEMDTVIRMGYFQDEANFNYKIRPRKGKVQQHTIELGNTIAFNPDGSFNDNYFSLGYNVSLKTGQEAGIEFNNSSIDLLFPFSFTNEGEVLPKDFYNFSSIEVGFDSDGRKAFSYGIEAQTGSFYNGWLNRFEVNANYRIQPWGNFSLGYQINDLKFPDPYGKERIGALLSKVEIGFSRNLLWTTLFQFVDQQEFMGINSRLQWRFLPMSDLYLVFIDNYDVLDKMDGGRDVQTNNRALILKVNYWY